MNNDRKNRMTKKTGGPAFPTQGYDHGAAMTTNKPNVQRYADMGCPEQICRVDTMHESDDGDYVLYEDYEALREECEKLRAEVAGLRAALAAQFSQEPVGFVSQDFLDGKWTLDHIAKTDTGQISRVIPVFTRAQPSAEPDTTDIADRPLRRPRRTT